MLKYVVPFGLALALQAVLPGVATAQQQVYFEARVGQPPSCAAMARRMRADFAAYRTARASRSGGTRVASTVLRVGIRIAPQGSLRAAATTERAAEFVTFRRQQMRAMAQMRRNGCRR